MSLALILPLCKVISNVIKCKEHANQNHSKTPQGDYNAKYNNKY